MEKSITLSTEERPPTSLSAFPEPNAIGQIPTLARVGTTANEMKPLLGVSAPVTYQLRGGNGIYLITHEANLPNKVWPEYHVFDHSDGFVREGSRLTIIPFSNGTLPYLDIRTPMFPKGEVRSYIHTSDEKTSSGASAVVPHPSDHLVGNRHVAVEARDSLDLKPDDRVVLFQAYLMDDKGQTLRPNLARPKLLGLRREGHPNAVGLTIHFLLLGPDADHEAEAKRFQQDTYDSMSEKRREKD